MTEPSVDFEYPAETKPAVVNDDNIRKLLDFITYYLLTEKDPRVSLIALCYLSGYNVGEIYNCNNSVRAIAKTSGINYQKLYRKIEELSERLKLKPRP